jgi:phosphoglycerate kinase
VTTSISNTTDAKISKTIGENELGVDIGPESLKKFNTLIAEAGTVFWNGPMGVFETPAFSKGTFGLAKAIAESRAVKIVGGGDSASAAEMSGYADKMTHISTGGGASLEYLQGDKLPGLEVLRFKIRN